MRRTDAKEPHKKNGCANVFGTSQEPIKIRRFKMSIMKIYYIMFIANISNVFLYYSRLHGIYWRTFLFSSGHICSIMFKSKLLTGQHFKTVRHSLERLCCCTRFLVWSCVMLIKPIFLRVWYQIVLRHVSIQLIRNITFYVSLKQQSLMLKLHCVHRITWDFSRNFVRKLPVKRIIVQKFRRLGFQQRLARHS